MEIPDVVLVEARSFADDRGSFKETYKWSDYKENDIPTYFVQDNDSHSVRGVLRGLHYQLDPTSQGKLVRVIEGEIYDVAVDLRSGSPTYGRWVAVELSGHNHKQLYVPEGFAHGFQVLSEEAYVVYKVTREYAPEQDRGVAWNDPELAIPWPIREPVLSEKDAALPMLQQADINFVFLGEPS